jgi:hypothetical protein
LGLEGSDYYYQIILVQAHVQNLTELRNNVMSQKLRELKYEDSSIKLIEARVAELANLCFEGCIFY